jgi:hypothetical protein
MEPLTEVPPEPENRSVIRSRRSSEAVPRLLSPIDLEALELPVPPREVGVRELEPRVEELPCATSKVLYKGAPTSRTDSVREGTTSSPLPPSTPFPTNGTAAICTRYCFRRSDEAETQALHPAFPCTNSKGTTRISSTSSRKGPTSQGGSASS